jgi:hypothetical protein
LGAPHIDERGRSRSLLPADVGRLQGGRSFGTGLEWRRRPYQRVDTRPDPKPANQPGRLTHHSGRPRGNLGRHRLPDGSEVEVTGFDGLPSRSSGLLWSSLSFPVVREDPEPAAWAGVAQSLYSNRTPSLRTLHGSDQVQQEHHPGV